MSQNELKSRIFDLWGNELKPLPEMWLLDWALQRGAHYTPSSAHLGSCHTSSISSRNLPTFRITADWEKWGLINLVGLVSPGSTKQSFIFVPQFPVCKADDGTVLCHWHPHLVQQWELYSHVREINEEYFCWWFFFPKVTLNLHLQE